MKKKTALVLAGGAARGAYEVGVVDYVLREVAKDVGGLSFDILCGTSVGALNACALAAFADQGAIAMPKLVDVWTQLDVSKLVALDLRGFLGMNKGWLAKKNPVPAREGGLIDPTGLEKLIADAIPFDRILPNLKAGYVDALTVSTTHVATGNTVVFVQRGDGKIPRWSRDPTIEPRPAHITAEHALASAAVPILFRAVKIDGEYHCDGGLRQNVPLSPARRLGADAVLVVNPRRIDDARLSEKSAAAEEAFPSPFFLLGKTRCSSIASTPTSRASKASTESWRRERASTATRSANRSIRRSATNPEAASARCARRSFARAKTSEKWLQNTCILHILRM